MKFSIVFLTIFALIFATMIGAEAREGEERGNERREGQESRNNQQQQQKSPMPQMGGPVSGPASAQAGKMMQGGRK